MSSFTKHSPHPYKHSELTEKIIGCFYTVYKTLGYGFLEKIYENAMRMELAGCGLSVVQQRSIEVWYYQERVGEYYADLLVNDLILVEIKAVKSLMPEHEAQLLNYLKATPYEVGLLLNFGPQPQQMRRVFENTRKEWWLLQNQVSN
jgi:GxxExxY protein